ncbi:MAG: coproporphyrinogen III oxidase family protein [Proteobacteria bacterium]|nr:coproporphyrinogen III oxidase family protein [Pseudomonadota bacterium]
MNRPMTKERDNPVGRSGQSNLPSRQGLYIHVPFCTSKCPYCDFNSVPVSGPTAHPFDSFEESRYIDCLMAELDSRLKSLGRTTFNPATLYFGGGTPSLLSAESVARFISHVNKVRGKGGGSSSSLSIEEITLEANPESVLQGPVSNDKAVSKDKLRGYLDAGVNRLSIGVQSFSDAELKLLGRPHSVEEAVTAYEAARAAGFENIGIDLIFGLPGRTVESWRESLKRAVELRPEHISLYGLTIEEGTPFYARYSGESVEGPSGSSSLGSSSLREAGGTPKDGTINDGGTITDETYVALYSVAIEVITGAGYDHYEVSNFALPGRRSLHNSSYWSGAEYLGLGAGAHSLVYSSELGKGVREWGTRSWNISGVSEYEVAVERTGVATEGSEELTGESAALEAAMLGLRRLDIGIVAIGFKERFGALPVDFFAGAIDLIEHGLLYKGGEGGEDLLLTPKGVTLSDTVIARL